MAFKFYHKRLKDKKEDRISTKPLHIKFYF